jgi:ABC-type cobalamin transport system ATPase subunit
MMDNIDKVADKMILILRKIEKYKIVVAKAYNKKVKSKPFQVGHLVILSWRFGLEDNLATKEQVREVWQMVTKLGRALHSYEGNIWQYVYIADSTW